MPPASKISRRQQGVVAVGSRYVLAAGLVIAATFMAKITLPLIGEISPFYFVAVMLSSWFGGMGPGLFATALVGWASVFFFFDFPRGTAGFGWDDLLRLVVFLLAALLISFLLNMRRRAERELKNANDHLEVRVVERTRELEASNRMVRESEEGFRALIEGVSDSAICMLDQQGLVVQWNSGAERIQGYTEAEVLRKHFEIFFPPQDHLHVKVMEHLSQAAKIGWYEQEGWRIRKDGSPFRASVIISSLKDESGNLRGFAHVARDITELKRLEEEVLEISESEQRRIGHDLHDGLGQELTGLAFLTQNVGRKLAEASRPEAAELGRIANLINMTIEQTRDLATGLAPVEWGPDGLSAALQNLAVRTRSAYGIACEFQRGRTVNMDSQSAAVHLYRIAQEALGNAARHSKGTQIWISLDGDGYDVILQIQDNGTGIPPASGTNKGMGLHLMPYRARTIGATFELQARPGGGTLIRCIYRKTGDAPIDPEQVVSTNKAGARQEIVS